MLGLRDGGVISVLNSIRCVLLLHRRLLFKKAICFAAPPRAGALLSRFVEIGVDSRGLYSDSSSFVSADGLQALVLLFWRNTKRCSSDSPSTASHASPSSPDGHYGRLDTELLSGERNGMTGHDQNGSLIGLATSAVVSGRRDVSRPGVKSFEDDMDLENGKDENGRDKPLRYNRFLKLNNQAFLSGLAYCLSSCGMILVNKFVLSGYDFSAGISLMLYQNFVSVILVSTLSSFGVVSTEPLTWNLIKVWLPVNIIFVGMLATSMLSLKYINVAMVTVLKNVTNVITAIGEMYLFMKHHDRKMWTALILMIISAFSGGITDLSFHAIGYGWQILNCFLTASYSLTLRRVMDTAKQVTKSGNLNEFSMVKLNNLLSLPLGLLLIFAFNEVDYLYKTPLLKMPMFWVVTTLSGFLGLAISFTSMWFLHQTGATTYSLVGSLNKIPLSIAGILLFKVPTSLENLFSILFGLLAGVFFARAKMR